MRIRALVCPIDHNFSRGFTPLHCSVIEGNVALTEELLDEHEVFLNMRDIWGNTPLHWAIIKLMKLHPSTEEFNRRKNVLRLLLQTGSFKEYKNMFGQLPEQYIRDDEISELYQSYDAADASGVSSQEESDDEKRNFFLDSLYLAAYCYLFLQ